MILYFIGSGAQAPELYFLGGIMDMQENYSRKSQNLAILSACFGAISEVMIRDSAVIILFAGMLGAGSMLSMVTTSLTAIMQCMLLIPAAYLVARIGYKRSIIRATYCATLAIFILAFSPFFGVLDKYVMMLALITYGILITLYVASWFPFLDEFLPKDDRSVFFGRLRFSWQMCSVIFFFICGLIMGENPPLWVLQTIIAIAAAALLGRVYFISRIKVSEADRKPLRFRHGLEMIMANKPLLGFSVYIAFLYLAAQGTMPLTYVFLKQHLNTPDNIVVIISSLGLGGMIIGFFFSGRIVRLLGIKKMLLTVHFAFALTNFLLFWVSRPGMFYLAAIAILMVFYGFFIALSSVAVSSEMMGLANPENKAMAMAFCGTMLSAGLGGSRFLSSLIIGSGILSPAWTIGTTQFTMYHTMFLGYGLATMFVCVLLVIVPAIFPKGEYHYVPQ